ncbi:MAG: DUF1501 domain-containing protein [Gemmatimonadaceae bacterium]
MERRAFVKSGALALVTLGLSPSFLRRMAYGMDFKNVPKGKTLVCLFQRGAADGLNVLVPHGEKAYYDLRPTIAVARPGAGANSAIDLDGFFGLHPSLAPLKPLWDQKLLAPIHAVGSPSSSRSHFDAQDFMETGTPDVKGTPDGWLNRLLAVEGTCQQCATPSAASSAFRAIAMTPQTPRILEGRSETIAMNSLGEFSVRTTGSEAQRLEALYRTGSADLVHGAGQEMFDAVKLMRSANPQQYAPRNGAQYPRSQFGQRLMQIAQLIKSNVGLEVAFADVGGWDTHVNQGGGTGQLAARLDDFSKSVAAFVVDMGDQMNDVMVLTMSEFGRTAHENGNRGTDHGHATAFFVLGGGVKGGKVYGKWPGLEPEQLNEGRDLKLTTDFRTVFSEVAVKHLGATRVEKIFPGYAGGSHDWLGLV